MEKKPLVSIITPSYNQGVFIEETILSIKNQSYPFIEHIIVDGASTDNTLEVIKKYEGTYNMRWISEPDSGMYEAINKGLKMAKGQILAYLNADDLYMPWTVEVVVKTFEKYSNIDLVHGDALCLKEELKRFSLIFYAPINKRILKSDISIGQPSTFWRRRVYEEMGGFDEELKYVGDAEYWRRALLKYGFGILKIKEIVAIERHHKDTKQEREKENLKLELQKVLSHYNPSLKNFFIRLKENLFKKAYNVFFRRYYMLLFLLCFYTRKGWAWSFFIKEGVKLCHWYKLPLSFIPFVNKEPFWRVEFAKDTFPYIRR